MRYFASDTNMVLTKRSQMVEALQKQVLMLMRLQGKNGRLPQLQ